METGGSRRLNLLVSDAWANLAGGEVDHGILNLLLNPWKCFPAGGERDETCWKCS
ncbi:MAG: hypothetical protein QW543_07130 [Sulfolobales archaeon]